MNAPNLSNRTRPTPSFGAIYTPWGWGERRRGGGGGGGGGGVFSYPDPDSHSCGWITSPLHVAVM